MAKQVLGDPSETIVNITIPQFCLKVGERILFNQLVDNPWYVGFPLKRVGAFFWKTIAWAKSKSFRSYTLIQSNQQ
jgi:hypothetical protein